MKPSSSPALRPSLKAKSVSMCACAGLMLIRPGLALAQDSLRSSLAGDAAAEAQRQEIDSQLYTYKAGDFRLLVVPSLQFSYNDNINLVKTNAQEDFIITPGVQLVGSYPVTRDNVLSLSVGLGYDTYWDHSQYDTMRINSGSLLSFDMYVKDFWFNFHDGFSAVQDPGANATVAGTAQYGTFNNTSGASATCDLNALVLTLGYDHQISLATSGLFSYLDRSSELPLARVGFRFDPHFTAGMEGSASYTSYDENVLNNNQSYSAGLYADWSPDKFLHLQPRAGYTIYQFQQTSLSGEIFPLNPLQAVRPVLSIQTANQSTWYADLTASHQINPRINYTLSTGHELQLGTESDLIEDTYARANIGWQFWKNVSVNGSLFYDHGNQGVGNIAGNFTETYNWYGGSLMLGYALMKKLQLSLNYRLTFRASNDPFDQYTQNIIGLGLSYRPQ
jgi:hypothetical protein